MNCLHPITVRIDRKDADRLHSNSVRLARYGLQPNPLDYVQVPCGKCINCLKNKQSYMVARCISEAEDKGTFGFLTLTYDNDHLPISQSLWRVSKETGEYENVVPAEVICSARYKRLRGVEKYFQLRMPSIRNSVVRSLDLYKSSSPVYVENDIPAFEDDEFVYKQRLTPSLCRKDVRLWLKNSRVLYERERGVKLPSFSYVLVGEMGPNTCRPHYHLCFFGLKEDHLRFLSSVWTDRYKYGYHFLEMVNRINKDGSDGFTLAAKYVGKYVSKGKFDCESVKDKSAEKSRVCQSVGLGKGLIDKLRSSMLCFDMYGEYDIDSLFCPSLGRCFNEKELDLIVKEVPKRLSMEVLCKSGSSYRLPIPRLIRNKVFKHECSRIATRNFVETDCDGKSICSRKIVKVNYYQPSTLWGLVSRSIRDYFSAYDSAKFEANLSKESPGKIATSCLLYDDYEKGRSQIAEFVGEKNYIDFLSSSIF